MRLIPAESSALPRQEPANALTARGIQVTGQAADPATPPTVLPAAGYRP